MAYICQSCGYEHEGYPKEPRGSILIETILWFFVIIIIIPSKLNSHESISTEIIPTLFFVGSTILYSIWRHSYKICPTCLDREPQMRKISETKAICKACGHIYFFGKTEEREYSAAKLEEFSNAALCCGGCLPAIFIPKPKEVADPNRCPKCGSRAIVKERVIHEA